MSQVHTCSGPVATSSGLVRAGWRGLAAALAHLHRGRAAAGTSWRSSTGRCPRPAAWPRPAPGTCRRTAASAAPPVPVPALSSDSAAGCGGRRRGAARPRPGLGVAPPVERWPASVPVSSQAALVPSDRLQLRERLGDHFVRLRASGSSLSESSSKSACAFPRIASAFWVLASSAASRSFSRRSLSASFSAGLLPRRPGGLGGQRVQRAGVAGGRQSRMWEWYRPSRRSSAPLAPGSVSRVVLGHDPQLVLRGERPPLRPARAGPAASSCPRPHHRPHRPGDRHCSASRSKDPVLALLINRRLDCPHVSRESDREWHCRVTDSRTEDDDMARPSRLVGNLGLVTPAVAVT